MARRPSVFVRPLSMDEGRKIQKISRSAKDPVRLRRAIVVMMSGQGQTVRDITSLPQVSEGLRAGRDPRVQRAGVRRAGPKMERGTSAEDR